MSSRKIICVSVVCLEVMAGSAHAQHSGMHGSSWHGSHAVGGHSGFGRNFGSQYAGLGAGGFYGAYSPMLAIGPFGFMPPLGWMGPPFLIDKGPLLPPPPPGLIGPNRDRNRANLKPADPVRSGQLTTLGDRLFRAGNFKKAEDRYNQAMRAAPDLALPRVRLGQIAMVRGQYGVAADRLREAETAQPGWVLSAPDIQALYGEPTEFANNVARLESYLQANPDDRDAWLVLGAEWFLSGRTNKAADVFRRLNDPNRKPDVALAAFLDASNQAGLKAAKPPDAAEPAR